MSLKPVDASKQHTIRIAFLDVGQGDTSVITCPETREAIVIDCIDEKAVLAYLAQEGVTHLRGIIITHLHSDHYLKALKLFHHTQPGLGECERLCFNPLVKNRKLRETLVRDKDKHSSDSQGDNKARVTAYENLLEAIRRHKSRFRRIFEQDDYPLPIQGDLAQFIKVIHPHSADFESLLATKELNNSSVVLHIASHDSSALLMGDLEPAGFEVLHDNHPDLQANVVKMPHHGGGWTQSETTRLLNQTQPSVVVISVGTTSRGGMHVDKSNRYGHPTDGVFEALSEWKREQQPLHLLCTQATSQCKAALLDASQRATVRDALLKLYRIQANRVGRKMIGSKKGCPCAGTVVIELVDQVNVLQPTLPFHHNVIIKHLTEHRCHLPAVIDRSQTDNAHS